MDKVRLVKWDDAEVARRGWEGGLAEMGEELGYTVDDLKSYWWVDDEFEEFEAGPVPEGSTYEEVEGNVVIHNRIFMTSVAAVVVSRSDTEMVVLVEDGSVFF